MGIIVHKYVHLVFLVLTSFFLHSCYVAHKKDLTLNKIPFEYSDLIRTDGYYYFYDSTRSLVYAYAFCRNGFMYGAGGSAFESHKKIEEIMYREEIYDNIDTWSFYRLSADSIVIQGMTLTGSSEIMGIWDVHTSWGKIDSDKIVLKASKITGFKRREHQQIFRFLYTGKEINCNNIRMIK